MPRTKLQFQLGEARRAATYARVSDKSQAEDDKTSLYEQVADMESYCMKEGLTITARYQEVGHGWSKGRPEFQRMLADARSGLFDTIVCWKSDRLSRGMYPAAALMEVVEAHQVQLKAVMDAIDMKTFGLMAAIGKIEIDNFRERASMGRRGMAKQGRIPTSEVPYGYRRGGGGNPEIEEDESDIVRRIFRQYVHEGMGAYRIARELMADGIPTKHRGTHWNRSTVSRMLSNATYKGTWWYGRQRHTLTENGRRVQKQPEDTWIAIPVPQLVDETTWEKAQEAKIHRTNRAKRNTKVVYMLQHLVRCTECGMLLGGKATRQRTIRRNGKVYYYEVEPPHRFYRCYGISKGMYGCREHPIIRADKLEGLVWNEVTRVAQTPELIIAGINSARGSDGGLLKVQVEQVERELGQVQGEDDRAIRLHVSGKISETQLDRQRKFILEKSQKLQAKLEECRSLEAAAAHAEGLRRRVLQWSESVRGSLQAPTLEERREILLHLLDGVTIDGEDKVSITLSISTEKLVAIEELGIWCRHR